jgi:hypothetical protein
MAPLSKFSTSYNTDAARRGTFITVPIVSNITATTAYPAYEVSDVNMGTANQNGVGISLQSYYKATVGVQDIQFHGSSFIDVEKFAFQQGKAVAKAVFQDVVGGTVNVTSGSNVFYTQTVTGGAASFGVSAIRTARQTLVAAGASIEDAFLVLNPAAFANLLSDSTNLLANLAFGGDAIREGKVPRILGLDAMEVASMPSTNNVFGFVAHPSAIAVAVRPLTPQDNSYYIESRVISDDETGLSLTYRRHYQPANGTHWVTFESLYGYTAGITQGLVNFHS